jgi:hypothetical protein
MEIKTFLSEKKVDIPKAYYDKVEEFCSGMLVTIFITAFKKYIVYQTLHLTGISRAIYRLF